jgi:electron transfer flavoprotein beta subunit
MEMNILVCVKQVPDLEQMTVTCGADGSAFLGEVTELRMNRFDEFAVEEALRLKETRGDVGIDVVSVGPEAALAVIKRAVGMGADQGVLLQTGDGADVGPAQVAERVAEYARKKRYDLIFTGSWSEDGMNGQVGPMTAALLDLPCATQVMALDLDEDCKGVSVEREVEAGARERLWLQLPALLTLQSGINRPRYPSLSNLLRANRQPVDRVAVDSDANGDDPVACLGIMRPPRTRAGRVLGGSLQEKAEAFLTLLREKAFIR